jgi:hypothetical protein
MSDLNKRINENQSGLAVSINDVTQVLVLHYVIELIWESGRFAPPFVVSFTLLPLDPRENSCRYPLDRELDGPQGRSGRYGEDKNLLELPGIESRSSSP